MNDQARKKSPFDKDPNENTPYLGEENVVEKIVEKEVIKESPRVLLSDTDAYIHDRMKAQPKDLDSISVQVEDNKDPNVHRLSLPKELEESEKKFVFKWLMKHKQNLDYNCDVRGWTIVNSGYFPELPKHMFTVNGSIERGDCILAFIPRAIAEARRKEPSQKSAEIVKGMYEKHQNDPRYYAPDSGTSDPDGKKVKMI